MNQKEIKELIEFLVEKDIAEFELQRGDMKLLIKRGASAHPAQVVQVAPAMVSGHTVASAPPASPSSSTSPTADAGGSASGATPAPSAAAAEADLFILKSPIVGTFYEAPSPGAPPFVKLGEAVKEGQVLCIIEAMKLMNEIEADVSGVIAKMFVSNASPVEYGMPLFGIKRG
ncbi:MAG: acetyl-CoA carboxylase biotin carboxyl carrier protein [Candidatus Korobacteraceae bacterium]